MRRLSAFVPALILGVGCALIWQTHTQRAVPLAAPLTTILPSMPGYTVHDQHVTEDERRVAGMTDYVARAYARDSIVNFTTLVSYYDRQSQGKTIHSPRNCLPGAGWEILRGGTVFRPVPADQSPAENAVRRDADAKLATHWQNVTFDATRHQRVLDLQPGYRMNSESFYGRTREHN